jgi:hypothetical protein
MNRARVGARVFVARMFAFALVLGWTQAASAHPGYPAVIDTTLSLTGKVTVETVFPPTGCQLCHHSSGGGDALKAFGNLLIENYGLDNNPANEDDPSLEAALAGLEADDPEAVKDLKAGVDPNGDPLVFANALPTPEYGCAAVPARNQPLSQTAWLVAFFGLSAVAIRGARRALRSAV